MCSTVGSFFEFSQIGHHGVERWSFSKEHLSHVPVVAPNLRNVDVRRAYPKASGLGQIVPRRSFSKENLLVLHNACQQVDFMLSPKRDLVAAKHFLQLALGRAPAATPRLINVYEHPEYPI